MRVKTNWRILRRLLIGLAAICTIFALFYTEENWRGKRAWEECKRELQAQGAVLDWEAYIPPPVPDDQNIFKAPKMQEWFVGREKTDLYQRIVSTNTITGPIDKLKVQEATHYLAWSGQFVPDFDKIREALKRPFARMDGDYEEMLAIPMPNFVALRVVAQTLARRAQCYLLLQEPESALQELTLMHDIPRLLEASPTGKPMTLVSAMVSVAISGLYANTIADSLRVQAWREPQLVVLQRQLGATQLPPLVEDAFLVESARVCRTLESTPPELLANQRLALTGGPINVWHRLLDPLYIFSTLTPRGWIYQNMATYAVEKRRLTFIYNPSTRIISPEKAENVARGITRVKRWHPYTYFAAHAIPNVRRAWQAVALNQTLINEATIACALERYHLAHGSYPETLDSLVPQYIDTLPQDIVSGSPLKYRRTADGKFLLYSVAWNLRDDGGSTVSKDHRPTADDNDWVWQ
jgi:hypothetical protein